MAIKLGDTVQQILPAPISGTVIQATLDDQANRLWLVEWTDGEGEVQQRYFGEDEIEVVESE